MRRWAAVVILSSVLIMLVALGAAIALLWTSHPDPATGITTTTVERAAFFGARFVALPCGLLNVLAGGLAWPDASAKGLPRAATVVFGAMGLLLGILSWAWYIMVSSFVF
ncbi:MAG: hypothetical protein OEY20_03610 [Gemmatimonadota bacterium]|nr:hypothetical protein [Gemmatimonadota bacterium]